MSLKVDTKKAPEKIDCFISEIDALLNKSYTEGDEPTYSLDIRIRNFAQAAFSDSKEKISSYNGFHFAFLGDEKKKTPDEEQDDYIKRLKQKRRHLIAWKEEVELNTEISSDSQKITEIKEQIEEKGLESKRRQKVAETKFYGAVIELLDFQRNILKEKEQTTKSIIEIKKEISDIKEMVKNIAEKKS